MMTSQRLRPKTAKAGDQLTGKAAAHLREHFPFMREFLKTPDACHVHKKSDKQGGQWACIDCGHMIPNNMQAQGHARSHRLAWWTGDRFEEP